MTFAGKNQIWRLLGCVLVVVAWIGFAFAAAFLLTGAGEDRVARTDSAEPRAGQMAARSEPGVPPAVLQAPVAPLVMPEPAEIELPRVLSDDDLELYKEIFAIQAQAKWQVADYLIEKLADKRLIGTLLAQRYLHPTGYRSKYRELRTWMSKYADHAEAKEIYKLALSRRPGGARLPRKPAVKPGSVANLKLMTRPPYQSKKSLTKAQRRRVRQLIRRLHRHIGRNQLTTSEKLLGSAEVQRLFDQVQLDDATANVAAAWLYYGKYEKADELVSEAAMRSGHEAPLAHWTAGLATWRRGDFARAAVHFQGYARANGLSRWSIAAGAYWAARCHWQLGDRDSTDLWLAEAARYSRTFYGLLALQRLGRSPGFEWEPWELEDGQAAALIAKPAGARALIFMQLGDVARAEHELMNVEGWDDPAVAKAMLMIAEVAKLPALSARLAERLVDREDPAWTEVQLDRALYPLPPWEPKSEFRVDRALVYAVMRQESRFKHRAKSTQGARGLMQLMPATARAVAKRRFAGRDIYKLYDPALNIDLGQRYLAQLLKHPRVEGDLFRLAVAYNGGPGNLGKWQRRIAAEDPLLFVENLPNQESRMFIERVLTNLWIYRARLGQPSPSLAAAASGYWPGYQALDGGATPRAQTAAGEIKKSALEAEAWRTYGVY